MLVGGTNARLEDCLLGLEDRVCVSLLIMRSGVEQSMWIALVWCCPCENLVRPSNSLVVAHYADCARLEFVVDSPRSVRRGFPFDHECEQLHCGGAHSPDTPSAEPGAWASIFRVVGDFCGSPVAGLRREYTSVGGGNSSAASDVDLSRLGDCRRRSASRI